MYNKPSKGWYVLKHKNHYRKLTTSKLLSLGQTSPLKSRYGLSSKTVKKHFTGFWKKMKSYKLKNTNSNYIIYLKLRKKSALKNLYFKLLAIIYLTWKLLTNDFKFMTVFIISLERKNLRISIHIYWQK